MSQSVNTCILAGRICNDPSLEFTPNGTPVARFRLATDRPQSSEARAAGVKSKTDFHNIVAWNGIAKAIAEHGSKGRLVHVMGPVNYREWTDLQTNMKRQTTEIVVDNFTWMDSKKSDPEISREESDYTY